MGTACRPSAPDCLATLLRCLCCSRCSRGRRPRSRTPPAARSSARRARRRRPRRTRRRRPSVNPGGIDPSQPLPTPAPALTTPVPAPLAGDVARVLPERPGGRAGRALRPSSSRSSPRATGSRRRRYIWGGGHRRWEDRGYDCSGSVSYALHGAGLLDAPLVSGELGRWGDAGPGRWVTIYAQRRPRLHDRRRAALRHLRPAQAGSRWQAARRSSRGLPRAPPRRPLSASTVASRHDATDA